MQIFFLADFYRMFLVECLRLPPEENEKDLLVVMEKFRVLRISEKSESVAINYCRKVFLNIIEGELIIYSLLLIY